ncbi:MAG TPA: hypothetical protein VK434_20775, partial [Microvirga sp.]|nr:hypothetical protein [Microvirga sp.]
MNLMQEAEEELPELPDASIALPELLMQRRPRHELRSSIRNAVKALGEPAVHIERYRRVGERGDSSLVERDSI